jgi:hypothetical protein
MNIMNWRSTKRNSVQVICKFEKKIKKFNNQSEKRHIYSRKNILSKKLGGNVLTGFIEYIKFFKKSVVITCHNILIFQKDRYKVISARRYVDVYMITYSLNK